MKYLMLLVPIFSHSVSVAVTPHAYVTDPPAGTVRVIDVLDNEVQTISGFNGPRVIKVTPDGTLAFVGSNDNTIRVIDTISHVVLPPVIHVFQPTALAVSPDGQLIYVLSSNDTVSVIRTTDYSTIAVVAGFHNAQDLKLTPDGAFAYVTNAGNGSVSVIRTSDNTIVNTITGFRVPLGLTFSVDGDYAYVTDSKNNSVYVIRISDNTISDVIFGLNVPSYAAVSPNKSYLYVSNFGNNTVSIIRTHDHLIVGTIHIPNPKSIAVTQDGGYLYVGSIGTVFKVRLLDDNIVIAVPGFINPSNITLTTNNAPANTVNACQNRVSSTEFHNEIFWQAPLGISPVNYRIYRDVANNDLVGIFSPGSIGYVDNGIELGQTYTYYVVAVYENGFSSSLGSVEVTPNRTCLLFQ